MKTGPQLSLIAFTLVGGVLAGCAGETEILRIEKNAVSTETTAAVGSPAAGSGGGDSSTSTGTLGAGGSTTTEGSSTSGGIGGSGGGGGSTLADSSFLDGPGTDAPKTGPINVLVFNHTAGYGHQSRFTAIPLLQAAASANNIVLDLKYAHLTTLPEGQNDSATPPDLSAFVPGGLDKYDVVFFLNTTGHVFQGTNEALHQQALQDYMEKSHGGFVGTHSATDTYDENWQWYQDFIGSIYNGHSNAGTSGSARWKDGVTHPILTLAQIPNPWTRSEEWYLFPRDVSGLPNFTVLLLSRDQQYTQERPHAWVHNIPGGGRVFYSAFGHFVTAFQEPTVMKMLIEGIKWAGHRTN